MFDQTESYFSAKKVPLFLSYFHLVRIQNEHEDIEVFQNIAKNTVVIVVH